MFTIFSDHKPLMYAFRQKKDRASPRQICQLDYIGQFTSTDIRHIAGDKHNTADLLSTITTISSDVFDFEAIAHDHQTDTELKGILTNPYPESSLKLKETKLPNMTQTLICDTANNKICSFITHSFRKVVIASFIITSSSKINKKISYWKIYLVRNS